MLIERIRLFPNSDEETRIWHGSDIRRSRSFPCFGRLRFVLAGYEDVNDAERLALDPVMRQTVGGRAVDHQAASASQMGRFGTEVLTTPDNLAALAGMPARCGCKNTSFN